MYTLAAAVASCRSARRPYYAQPKVPSEVSKGLLSSSFVPCDMYGIPFYYPSPHASSSVREHPPGLFFNKADESESLGHVHINQAVRRPRIVFRFLICPVLVFATVKVYAPCIPVFRRRRHI